MKSTVLVAVGLSLFLFFIMPHARAEPPSIVFSAAGDYGSNAESWPVIRDHGGAFHLVLGDMSYGGDEVGWCNGFKSYFNNIVLVSGNHEDGSDGNIDAFTSACGYPLSESLVGTYGHLFYFDYPQNSPLIRVVLGSPDIFGGYQQGSSEYNFIRDAIRTAKASGIPWTAFGSHKVCIEPTGDKPCDIGTALMDMLLQEQVDLILQAHSHTYSRSHQLTCASPTSFIPQCVADSDGQFTKAAGTVVVIQGIGGRSTRSSGWGDADSNYFAVTKGGDGCSGTFSSCPSADYGMVQYSLTADSLSAMVYFAGGETFDYWTIGSAPPSPPPPTLTTVIRDGQGSAVTSAVVGTTVHDSTTLSSTSGTITGTVTYMRFSGAQCTGPSVDETVTVGTGNVVPDSSLFTTDAAGAISYKASYTGDSNNAAVGGACQLLTVAKASPLIATTIHDPTHNSLTSVVVGTTVHGNAVVSNGFSPTGTMTFSRFTTDDCTGTTVDETVTLGSEFSAFTTDVAGTISYRAIYNGDRNNNAATSACEGLTIVSPPPPPEPPPEAPVVLGWGGIRLDEAGTGIQGQKLADLGFNGYRVSFENQCGTNKKEMGPYEPGLLQESIDAARSRDMWLVVDYHGYTDLVEDEDCWLGFWRTVLEQFSGSYDKIIWEPLNEPTGIDVTRLSQGYQAWLDQARALGDTHWVVVQNLCSYACEFGDYSDGYPVVTDPLGKVLISLHAYMDYGGYAESWDNATAESVAQRFYDAMVSGSQRTGWASLNTEGGADPLCNCAPDAVLTGSAGYSNVTFHFIQTLTRLLDQHTPRINWMWWPVGGWTDTPGAGDLGALAPDGWGAKLSYDRVTTPAPPPPPPPPTRILGDVNWDGMVNIQDLVLVLSGFGTENPNYDLNIDGSVNLVDLLLVMSRLGQT